MAPSIPLVHQRPRHEGSLHSAVIGADQERKEQLVQRLRHIGAQSQQGRRLRIQHGDIGRIARREFADAVRDTERFCAAQGRQIVVLQCRHRDAAHLCHLVGFRHRLQHGKTGAAADIGAQADGDRSRRRFCRLDIE